MLHFCSELPEGSPPFQWALSEPQIVNTSSLLKTVECCALRTEVEPGELMLRDPYAASSHGCRYYLCGSVAWMMEWIMVGGMRLDTSLKN